MRIVILFFCVASVVAEVNMTLWMQGVEHLAHRISIPHALKPEFTPDYLGQRSLNAALAGQLAVFRSHVATAMVDCIGEELKVCPPTHIHDQVVMSIRDELKERGFEVFVLSEDEVCYHKKGLLIRVPKPVVSDPGQ